MEQHFVDALKTDNHLVIKELYNNNREAFLKFWYCQTPYL